MRREELSQKSSAIIHKGLILNKLKKHCKPEQQYILSVHSQAFHNFSETLVLETREKITKVWVKVAATVLNKLLGLENSG